MPHRRGFVTVVALALGLALFASSAGATSLVVRPLDVVGRTATLTATVFSTPGFHLDAFANPGPSRPCRVPRSRESRQSSAS